MDDFYGNLSHHESVIYHSCFAVKGCISIYGLLMLDSIESPHKVQMPGSSAELPIGNHMISKLLYLCDQF